LGAVCWVDLGACGGDDSGESPVLDAAQEDSGGSGRDAARVFYLSR
jgi:hypothetical protein